MVLLNLLVIILAIFAIFATVALIALCIFIIYQDIKDYKKGIKRYPIFPRWKVIIMATKPLRIPNTKKTKPVAPVFSNEDLEKAKQDFLNKQK